MGTSLWPYGPRPWDEVAALQVAGSLDRAAVANCLQLHAQNWVNMNTFLFEELLRSRVAKSKNLWSQSTKFTNLSIFLIEKRCLTSDINVSEMVRVVKGPKFSMRFLRLQVALLKACVCNDRDSSVQHRSDFFFWKRELLLILNNYIKMIQLCKIQSGFYITRMHTAKIKKQKENAMIMPQQTTTSDFTFIRFANQSSS